jgi:hypothetical protein
VFVESDRALINFWDSIHQNNWLSEITNVEFHRINQWCVFHLEFFLREQIIVLLEIHTFLFQRFSKIFSSVLLFVRIVANTTKSEPLIDERDKNVDIVDSIKVHQIMSLFLNSESIFLIRDFELFEWKAIIVNMHALNETLFSDRVAVGLGFGQKFSSNPWVWVRSGWVFK